MENQVNQSSQTPATPSEVAHAVSVNRKNKPYLIIVISLVVLMLLAGGAYFYFQTVNPYSTNTIMEEPAPTVEPTISFPSPTPTISSPSAELNEAQNVDLGDVESDFQDIDTDLKGL